MQLDALSKIDSLPASVFHWDAIFLSGQSPCSPLTEWENVLDSEASLLRRTRRALTRQENGVSVKNWGQKGIRRISGKRIANEKYLSLSVKNWYEKFSERLNWDRTLERRSRTTVRRTTVFLNSTFEPGVYDTSIVGGTFNLLRRRLVKLQLFVASPLLASDRSAATRTLRCHLHLCSAIISITVAIGHRTIFSNSNGYCIGPLPVCPKSGNRFILTVLDLATHYPKAIPLPDHTAQRVATALAGVFSRFGFPKECLSDQGTDLMSQLLQIFLQDFKITQIRCSAWHPQSNWSGERFHGTLKSMIRSLTVDFKDAWDGCLPWILFAYREIPMETLGFSPFEMLFGRNIRGPLALLKSAWKPTYIQNAKQMLYNTC